MKLQKWNKLINELYLFFPNFSLFLFRSTCPYSIIYWTHKTTQINGLRWFFFFSAELDDKSCIDIIFGFGSTLRFLECFHGEIDGTTRDTCKLWGWTRSQFLWVGYRGWGLGWKRFFRRSNRTGKNWSTRGARMRCGDG